jgi:PIN domain nuclease of toxin-antitoxin system
MRLLLDTDALLWFMAGSDRLSPVARAAEEDAAVVCLSVASLWEAAIKASLGKLSLMRTWAAQLQSRECGLLDIRDARLARLAALPPHHRDPFDRMLIAQAQAGDLTVVTSDAAFGRHEVPILTARA